jgi:hypothetical protein
MPQHSQDPELRERIVALKRAGRTQRQIADELHVATTTVYRYLLRAGLVKPGRASTAKILALLHAQPLVSYKEIAERVGCCKTIVKQVARAAGVRRRLGVPADVRAMLTDDILNRRAHAMALARKYRLSYPTVLRFCKKVLGVPGLRPAHPKLRLETFFASKWSGRFPKMAEPDQFVTFLRRFFPGRLPFPQRVDAWFATELTRTLRAQFTEWQAASAKEVAACEMGLLTALHTIRSEGESKWVH